MEITFGSIRAHVQAAIRECGLLPECLCGVVDDYLQVSSSEQYASDIAKIMADLCIHSYGLRLYHAHYIELHVTQYHGIRRVTMRSDLGGYRGLIASTRSSTSRALLADIKRALKQARCVIVQGNRLLPCA
jgi:hypothetical protein